MQKLAETTNATTEVSSNIYFQSTQANAGLLVVSSSETEVDASKVDAFQVARVRPGLVKHYKGGIYCVMGVAVEFVGDQINYYAAYSHIGESEVWIRALDGEDGFFTPKIIDGKPVTRFVRLDVGMIKQSPN